MRINLINVIAGCIMMIIRKVEQSDFSEWHRLRKLLYPDYSPNELMREIRAIYFDRNVVGELDYFVCAVENEKSKLCGFCETSLRKKDPFSHVGPVGYVESLFVDSSFRMKGLAQGMLVECEKWVRNKNCNEFWVDTEDKFVGALQCYQKFGFTVIKKDSAETLLKKKVR